MKNSRLSGVLHVLLHMAAHPDPMTSDAGARHGRNPVVIRRLMSGLRERGFVRSEKGHGGGWTIACDLGAVTLLDVYEALGRRAAGHGQSHRGVDCLVEQASTFRRPRRGAAFGEARRCCSGASAPSPSRR